MTPSSPLYAQDVTRVASLRLPWQTLDGKAVLVTGASGFLGSFLVDVLMARNLKHGGSVRVSALARSKEKLASRFAAYLGEEAFRIIPRDVCAHSSEPLSFNYIVHAASNTHPNLYAADPVGTITANAFGTYNLLNGCTEALEKFVLLSSVEIYGENRGDAESFDEDYCGYINCNTLRAGYPESKRLAEALCQAFMSKKGCNVAIARLARVYGPSRQDDSKASAQFLRNAARGEDIALKSKGAQVFSYIYYADAVSALLYVLFFGEAGEAYNAANDDGGISLFDLASLAAKIAGTKVIYAQAGEAEKAGASPVTRAVMSVEKLKRLGWRQQTSMEEGVLKTINMLREEIAASGNEQGGGENERERRDSRGGLSGGNGARRGLGNSATGGAFLVTGATGLVGASLVRLLSFLNEERGAGVKIIAMARDEKRARRVLGGLPVDLLIQDVREELRYSGKLDYIIDCASNNHPLLFAKEPVETIQANVRGIENLLEYARKAGGGTKVLFASSVEVYGNTERLGLAALKEGDFGSTDCNTVRACYTESKRLAETLCRSYFDEYDVPAYIARLGKTYGPFFAESDTKVMSYMLKCAARGENIVLKSQAAQRLSFCYSIDVAAALLCILFAGSPGEAYNVASRNSVFTLREVAERIAAFANVAIESAPPAAAERKGFTVIGDAVQNTDKLEGLGWQPKISMDDGLRHSIEYNRGI